MTVYTTCSGAVGTAAQPILFNTVLTGAGQVGGRVRVNLETEVTLGSYANAFKASVDLGTNGGVTGLLSVSCSEMTMATANISGTYAIEEWEMTYAATGSGSLPKPCFVYANTNGTKRTVFDDYGDFIIFGTGFTAATGHMFGAGTSTIRLGTGALGATKRYIPLSTAGDSFTTAYPIVLTYAGEALAIDTTIGNSATTVQTITVTDSGTLAAGRNIGLFVDYVVSGTKTGSFGVRSTRINTQVLANVPSVQIADWYLHTIDNKTIDLLFGLTMYWEDVGDNIANLCMIDLGKNMTHTTSSRDCFIRCREHTGVQTNSAVIQLEGDNAAHYLVNFASNAPGMDTGVILEGNSDTETSDMRIMVGTTVGDRYIYLYPV